MKCRSCGKISFPPRLVCPKCGGKEFEKVRLNETGEIVTFTTIRVAPKIVDCKPEDVEIGKKVRLVFRKIQEGGKSGIICYGYKAVLS